MNQAGPVIGISRKAGKIFTQKPGLILNPHITFGNWTVPGCMQDKGHVAWTFLLNNQNGMINSESV
jgi:hypothetical protein